MTEVLQFFVSKDVREYLTSFLEPFDTRCIRFTFQRAIFRNFPLVAASRGYLRQLEFFYKHYPTCLDSNAYRYAAGNGHLHIMEWLHSKGIPFFNLSSFDIEYVIKGGHLHILKWCHERRHHSCIEYERRICYFASEYGHLAILEWARSCHFHAPWNWKDIPENANLLHWSQKWTLQNHLFNFK